MKLMLIALSVLFAHVIRMKACKECAYLSQYGYLPLGVEDFTESTYEAAIKTFQEFGGLKPTGILDTDTLELMALPRCGVKDNQDTENSQSKKIGRADWRKQHLTYKISKYPETLDKLKVDAEIQRAFDVWSNYTNLSFTPKPGKVHIEIRFESSNHDRSVGYASYSEFGADVHFDARQPWTIGSIKGLDLFRVAVHEFGHSLGLGHSKVRSASMWPFYNRSDNTMSKLDQNDIDGIHALYSKKTKIRRSVNSNSKELNSKLCADPRFDTIFNSADGHTFVFKGNEYWELTKVGVAKGSPKLIYQGWPGLPGQIDNAFTYQNGMTYFFKGNQYWRYKGRTKDSNFPKDIKDLEISPVTLDNVSSNISWDKLFFLYNSSHVTKLSSSPGIFHRTVKAVWPGNITAAFKWTNGYTYVFKDDQYYRFENNNSSFHQTNPVYPRSTASWWFGCSSKQQEHEDPHNARCWAEQKRCEKKDKADMFDRLQVSIEETKKCIQSKRDERKQHPDDSEESKEIGLIETGVGEYCKHRKEYNDCITSTFDVTIECMEKDEIIVISQTFWNFGRIICSEFLNDFLR